MRRTLLAVCLAVAVLVPSCATVEGWFEENAGFALVQEQALSIAGVQPLMEGNATALAKAIDTALADPAGAAQTFGDQLDTLVGHLSSSGSTLDSKRIRLKELGSRMQSSWDEYVQLLPEEHPWRDAEFAAEERTRVGELMNEVDTRLASTHVAITAIVSQLRPAVDALGEGSGKGLIESQREVLETAVAALGDLPARIAEDEEMLRALAEEFSLI